MSLKRDAANSPSNWASIDIHVKNVVYVIRHSDTGKEYIGSTGRELYMRMREHRKSSITRKPGLVNKLYDDVALFGWNAFVIEVLEFVSSGSVLDAEIRHINHRNPEYNQAKGGPTPFHNWHHRKDSIDVIRRGKIGDRNPSARKVSVGGAIYKTVSDACRLVGISYPTIRSRLLSDKFPEYSYLEPSC